MPLSAMAEVGEMVAAIDERIAWCIGLQAQAHKVAGSGTHRVAASGASVRSLGHGEVRRAAGGGALCEHVLAKGWC